MTIARVTAKTLPHILASPDHHILKGARNSTPASRVPALSMLKERTLVEITLERSLSADVQSHTMGPAAKKLGVPQFKRDDIETFLFQKSRE